MATSKAYAESGVNLTAGDLISNHAGQICRSTYSSSRFVKMVDFSDGHFRGPRGWRYENLPEDHFLVGGSDGIGTATIPVSASGKFDSAASRLIAMTAGDITRYGGAAMQFFNVYESGSLGEPNTPLFTAHEEIISSLGTYARDQMIVLVSGETAEMPSCVTNGFDDPFVFAGHPAFNWSGTMIGVNHPDKLITGNTIKEGDVVVALFEPSFRSNGGSKLRQYVKIIHGEKWWRNPKAEADISAIATPAAVYDRSLSRINGWYDPNFKTIVKAHGIAHLSGGGVVGKFWEDLVRRMRFSVKLTNLFEPPDIVARCVRHFKIGDEEAYTIFSAGQGVLAVVAPDDTSTFINELKADGFKAQVAGEILAKSERPTLSAESRFSGKIFTVGG